MNQDTAVSKHNCMLCGMTDGIDRLCAAPRRLARWIDRHVKDLAPIFLRLLLAYEFGEAGLEKLHGDNWFADLSFPFPFNLLPADLNWTLATGLEILAPPLMYLFMLSSLLLSGSGRLGVDAWLRHRTLAIESNELFSFG